jgi:hypothetical protein
MQKFRVANFKINSHDISDIVSMIEYHIYSTAIKSTLSQNSCGSLEFGVVNLEN